MLIYDIETKVIAGRPNPDLDELRFFGWLVVETGQSGFYTYQQIKEIQDLINSHRVIIGFNVENYDNPILRRAGVNLDYKRIIDLYETVRKRKTMMKLELQSYALKSLAKHFKLSYQKQEDFDYKVLNKEKFSDEELQYMWSYLKQDLLVTRDLWNYLVNYFSGFKHYINEKNIYNYSFVSCSGGSLAYKAICHKLGLEEEYNEMLDELPSYTGGFVSLPKEEKFSGKIYAFDFVSLYPHMFIQANLYSHSCKCCSTVYDEWGNVLQTEKWHGNALFTEIKGTYCKKQMGKVELVLHELFLERLAIKHQMKTMIKDSNEWIELDRKQTSIKIIINTMYGISGSPVFKHVYNLNTASDCTYLARTTLRFTRDKFKEAGYDVIYSDTDSCFVLDIFNDEKKLLDCRDNIIRLLKQYYPFSQETFNLELEKKIKHMFFFKKDDGKFAKKFYLYVDESNDVVVKGIPIVKGNASNLSKKVYHDYILPHIKDKGEILIDKQILTGWIHQELLKDISLAAFLCKVGDFSSYKLDSQLQAQVSKFYGAGDHWLIPNYYIGAGLCLKYCTVDEFKQKGMSIHHIALDNIYAELDYFCLSDLQNKSLNRVQQVRMRKRLERNKQEQLQKWW